jgi:hypothetical protein
MMSQQFYEGQIAYGRPEPYQQAAMGEQPAEYGSAEERAAPEEAGQAGAYRQPEISRRPGAYRQSAMYGFVGKQQTHLSILYHLMALPLGIIYFTFIVTGLSLAAGTLVIWIGLPILFATLMGCWYMAAFERTLAREWLHIEMPPMSYRSFEGLSWWQGFRARLRHPVMWKSLVYLFLKFPMGIFSFTMTVTLVCTAAALILGPVIYLVDTLIYNMGTYPAHTILNFGTNPAYSVLVDGQIRAGSLVELLVLAVIGVGLAFVTRWFVNGLGNWWGRFAQVMLSEDI